jgi:sec-independent protein translocase protein TatB
MIDLGFDKLALIGAVALIVIGPERLPRVARTAGHLLGKARRYVADVRAEVNRSIELDELKKMKTQFEDAASSVQTEVNKATSSFENEWQSATAGLDGSGTNDALTNAFDDASAPVLAPPAPAYRHPKKNWRLKRGATPQWYKHRHGVRTKALSGAARVARYRPRPSPGSGG